MASFGVKTVQAPRKKLGPIDIASLDQKGSGNAASPRQAPANPTQGGGDSNFLTKFGFNTGGN